jgi:hypothetical protein
MLSLPHNLRSRRTHHHHVNQTGTKNSQKWNQNRPSVDIRKRARKSRGSSERCLNTRVGESQDGRKSSLEAKVDGEDFLLQRSKLWSRKGLKSYNATDEGLEELSAEQGTVSKDVRIAIQKLGRVRTL